MYSKLEVPPPPRHSVDAQRQQALLDAGDLDGAESLLRAHLAKCDDRLARLELSRVLFWQGRPDAAQALLERLQSEGDDAWCASFLGQVLSCLGDSARAKALFSRALRLDATNHEALTFLYGDALEQFCKVRERLSMHRLSYPEALAVAELCAAVDFKLERRLARASGPVHQTTLDRLNVIFDIAEVGKPVEKELSLHDHLGSAEKVVFYTSLALGDSILGLAVVDALERYFAWFPRRRVVIEIVSPYTQLFAGIERIYPSVVLKPCAAAPAAEYAAWCAWDLEQRRERSVVVSNAGPPVFERLAQVTAQHVSQVLDVHIDRIARGIAGWRGLRSGRELGSYPARMCRFMEIVLGHKLYDDAASVAIQLAAPALAPAARPYHCLIELASRPSKAFDIEILKELLGLMSETCQASGAEIYVCRDPDSLTRAQDWLQALPLATRRRIHVVAKGQAEMAALIAGAESVVSTDTGFAHVASALGIPLVVIFTVASPILWQTGGSRVQVLATRAAWQAYAAATPVNMPEWDAPASLMRGELSGRQIHAAWLELLQRDQVQDAALCSRAS